MKKRILIVEDDPVILVGLSGLFEDEEFFVISATDGQRGLELYNAEKPDLILLDIKLPKKNGIEVCKEIRSIDTHVPIIMLTTKDKDIDKVLGLEIGADDYIIKGCSFDELLARVRAVLRRSSHKHPAKKDESPINFGSVHINVKSLTGVKNGKQFTVTSRELEILRFLISNTGSVVSRSMLLAEIWGVSRNTTTRTLDQEILKIRRKVEDDPSKPKHIITIHGEGYRFLKNPKNC